MEPTTIALIISGISAAAGIATSQMSADAQEEAREQQDAQEEIRQRNEQAKQLREARGARAQAQQAAANQGVAGSSAEAGAISSVQSQMAGNLAFLQGEANTARGVSKSLQDASDLGTLGTNIQAVGSLFSTFAMKGAFSKKPETPQPTVQQQTMNNPPR